jgi:hypothetical protein
MISVSKSTRKYEPKSVDSGYFTLSVTQTAGLTVGLPIRLDTQLSGNMSINPSTYRIKLKANKRYKLFSKILVNLVDNMTFRWYDVTNSQYLPASTVGLLYKLGTVAGNTDASTATGEILTTTDIEVELRLAGGSAVTAVNSTYTYATIQEIQSYETPNTYPFLVNAQQYDLDVTGTNWTTRKATGYFYKTIDGQWFANVVCSGLISPAASSSITLSVSGLSFESGYESINTGMSGSAYATHTAVAVRYVSKFIPEGGTDNLYIEASGSFDDLGFSFDLPLAEKPDFI